MRSLRVKKFVSVFMLKQQIRIVCTFLNDSPSDANSSLPSSSEYSTGTDCIKKWTRAITRDKSREIASKFNKVSLKVPVCRLLWASLYARSPRVSLSLSTVKVMVIRAPGASAVLLSASNGNRVSHRQSSHVLLARCWYYRGAIHDPISTTCVCN